MKRSLEVDQPESKKTDLFLETPEEVLDLIHFYSINNTFYSQLQQTNTYWHKFIPDLFLENLPRLKHLFSHSKHTWLNSVNIFLHAAQKGLVPIFKFLSTEHHLTKNDKQLAFLNASQANQFEIVKLLLADPDISVENKASAMWWSIENNWMPLFDVLAVEEAVWQAIHLYPALYLAQDKGHIDIANKLSAKLDTTRPHAQETTSWYECNLM